MSTPKDARIPMSDAKESVTSGITCMFTDLRSISGPIVRVALSDIDKTDEVFVHLQILRSSSKFFQSATKPEWNELRDKPNTINIRVDPQVFKAYVHWLYTGNMPRLFDDPDDEFAFLAKLYVLGEELMDVTFKNIIIDIFVVVTVEDRCYPIGEPVAIIYAGTPASSPARRLMVDFCAHVANVKDDSWLIEFPECPKEFLVDALTATITLRTETPGSRPWTQSQSSYHESA